MPAATPDTSPDAITAIRAAVERRSASSGSLGTREETTPSAPNAMKASMSGAVSNRLSPSVRSLLWRSVAKAPRPTAAPITPI